ncbi:protein TESPA1 isoform X2 [Syngnathoides biaculeatus]|uniref:protein TESPA1 isoform X2 n=1 Tax=Syngnathoides biaculeatus TaxID=300417 RepID=UPI002ADE2DC3|nr:protein TESPA1 isoform X2 [Syngnathoides biaculeatus]
MHKDVRWQRASHARFHFAVTSLPRRFKVTCGRMMASTAAAPPAMESSSFSARRRTWASEGRRRSVLDEVSESLTDDDDDDDVFAVGCFTEKTEFVLQNCTLRACPQNCSLGSLGTCTHEHISNSTFSGGEVMSKAGLAMHPASEERNSGLVSNVPEVLQLHSEDTEEILWRLGFGRDDPELAVRIPPRFLSFPSQARGINFHLFLESQLRRIREEDPSLCIASRFRQVQALTAMANAFCSLYSHVSRTPLRKLGSPEFNFAASSPAMSVGRNVGSSARGDPHSPVKRLKDTVSIMCLYTPPRRKSSLSDVADPVPQHLQTTETLDLMDGGQTDKSKEDKSVGSQMVVKTHPR